MKNRTTEVIKLFAYGHLPPHLQKFSKPFAKLACSMSDMLPDNDERYYGLRKLLEAKDCFVRANIPNKEGK